MTPWTQVHNRTEAGIPVISVEGDIDLSNAGDLQMRILQHVPSTAPGVVLDLSGTNYLDSKGVHLLLDLVERLRTRRQRLAVVAKVESFVRRIIELSQVQTMVPVENEVDAALTHVRVP